MAVVDFLPVTLFFFFLLLFLFFLVYMEYYV